MSKFREGKSLLKTSLSDEKSRHVSKDSFSRVATEIQSEPVGVKSEKKAMSPKVESVVSQHSLSPTSKRFEVVNHSGNVQSCFTSDWKDSILALFASELRKEKAATGVTGIIKEVGIMDDSQVAEFRLTVSLQGNVYDPAVADYYEGNSPLKEKDNC